MDEQSAPVVEVPSAVPVVVPVAPVTVPVVVPDAVTPTGDRLVRESNVVRKSAIWQGFSVSVFLAGFGWFLYRLGELFSQHADSWDYFRTPIGVGDILQIIGSALMMTCGALGVNIKDLFARKAKP